MKNPFTGNPALPAEELLFRRALRLWGLFSLGALLTGLLALWIMSFAQPVIVPRIIGLTDKEASSSLRSKALKMQVEGGNGTTTWDRIRSSSRNPRPTATSNAAPPSTSSSAREPPRSKRRT